MRHLASGVPLRPADRWQARRRIGGDAAISIITTASFAFGVALISRGSSYTRNFEAALSGNILGVTVGTIMPIVAVTAVVALAVSFWLDAVALCHL